MFNIFFNLKIDLYLQYIYYSLFDHPLQDKFQKPLQQMFVYF